MIALYELKWIVDARLEGNFPDTITIPLGDQHYNILFENIILSNIFNKLLFLLHISIH